ncbi:MAG: hypothetical protein ACTHMS_09235 [Jatrophihabitans sp.]|uniref:hypothetical protein n=1 Tax=Jatrophihabitans sp. TaxID=1932789 RepID=UPI003F80B2C7
MSEAGSAPEERGAARRRRRRPPAATAPPTPPATTPVAGPPGGSADPAPNTARRGRRRSNDPDHALRDLVGAGTSQLGVDGALRGRDVNRPTDDDLAWAEANVQLVRRNWTPPASH